MQGRLFLLWASLVRVFYDCKGARLQSKKSIKIGDPKTGGLVSGLELLPKCFPSIVVGSNPARDHSSIT